MLPYFDAYTVGCHPRELLFPGTAAARALARGQAGNFPVLLIDGTVAGVWQQHRSGRRLDITVEPLRPLTARPTSAGHHFAVPNHRWPADRSAGILTQRHI